MTKTKERVIFWGILLAAVAVKGLYLRFSQASPFYEPNLLDPDYYHRWALKIADGDGSGGGVFYGLPLYPYFLAVCYKFFGVSVLAVKIIQAILGLLTLFFIYKTGKKIATPAVGLLAMGLAAFYGPLFFHEGIFIPEALSLPLYAGGFYALCLFEERSGRRHALLAGAVLGLAALTKAALIFFVAVYAVYRWSRRSSKGVFVFLIAFFTMLLPVTLHNAAAGDAGVFLTSHAGFNFYIGNNPGAEGVFAAPEGTGSNVEAQMRDSRAIAERAAGRALRPSEVSRYWSDKAWDFIRENPQKFLELCVRKLLLFFDRREISDVDDYAFSKRFNALLNLPWLDFTVLGPLVFLGLGVSVRRTRWSPLVYLWTGTYLAGLLAFFVNARYRLPLLGIFFPMAALALADLYAMFQKPKPVKIVLCAMLAAAGVGVGGLGLVGTNWTRDYVNAGDVYSEKNDFENARRFYEQALMIDPSSATANLAMGVLYSKQGRQADAKDYYLKAIARDPRSAQAYNNLGFWYDKAGDLETARTYFLKALEVNPDSPQAHNNLGMIYGKMGDYETAAREFEAALKINPKSARSYTNLGLVQYRMGKVREARENWLKALAIDPGFADAARALSALENSSISFDTA
jgi:tetratricopeptide (TPR) repeat protein